ncbi:MAG: (deoxy)nucleoside triphosphate pyrophosphohydrolase [Pikeienuella sp.]
MTKRIVNALLTRNDTILMARRSASKRHYPNQWSFPGGHVEPGETDDAALIRELDEELGITPSNYAYIQQIDDPDPTVTYQMFHVTEWSGEPAITNNEHSEIAWLTPDQATALPDLALPEYRALIQQITAPQHPEISETTS